jgi:cytochrome b involved in lipid metabolism
MFLSRYIISFINDGDIIPTLTLGISLKVSKYIVFLDNNNHMIIDTEEKDEQVINSNVYLSKFKNMMNKKAKYLNISNHLMKKYIDNISKIENKLSKTKTIEFDKTKNSFRDYFFKK